MKKIIALLLCLMLVCGMATVASATAGQNPSTVDAVVIAVPKAYTAANKDTVSPEEVFTFQIERHSYSDSMYETLDDIPMPSFNQEKSEDVDSISFAEGDAAVETTDAPGKIGTAMLYLPEYRYVGIYTYKISETVGRTAGVTYDESPLYLKVTVIEEDGLKRVAAMHYEQEDGSKVEFFQNTYSAGSLAVTKKVTGNLGDKRKDFAMHVTFRVPEGVQVKAPITYRDDGTSKSIEAAALEDGEETVKITLKHDETITFSNIPYGIAYTVVENDYTGEGYDASQYSYSNANKRLAAAVESVTIINNRKTEVDTGITMDSAPYILMLVGAVAGLGLLVSKKRYEV